MKKKYFIVLISIIVFTTENINAQKIVVGIGAGYGKITTDNYYSKNASVNNLFGLGLENLYQISTKIKYSLNSIPVYLTGDVSYFGGSSEYKYLGILNIYDSHFTEITLESTINIYSLGLGVEYPIQLNDFVPYLSISFLVNYFDDTKITKTPKPDDLFDRIPSQIESSSKLGVSLGGGIDYQINNQFLIGLSLEYNFMNLFGKKDILPYIKEDTMNILNISVNFLYSLN